MKKKSDLFKIGALSLLLSAGSTVSVWGNDFLQDVKLSIQQKMYRSARCWMISNRRPDIQS